MHCEVSKNLWNAIFSLALGHALQCGGAFGTLEGEVWLPTECNDAEDNPGLFVVL